MTYRIDAEKIFLAHPYAKEILARLIAAGYQAVLVGGVVRDGVRDLLEADCSFSPEEVDIATSALPTEIRPLFPSYSIVGVGEEFGVLVLGSPDGHTYEVATFRTEGEYSSGRWPRRVKLVRSLEGDIGRRDLTVNGLAAMIDGEVIDLVGGINDLVAHRIRAIGDPQVRFSEDYLRMLRTVRFACQINGEIEAITAEAIQKNAAKITSISWERIRDELLRILRTDDATRGITLFDSYGLLRHILPELTSLKGVCQPEKYHPEGDVYVHTIAALRVADG
ncbi:CCA tRNA nucleotidyltransferase, partial [Candidatus Bipolaricaulota bacterium]|nr:CCA tRNA nucleotidyltransferase [Candidatus Bipolaricaulota bacterium]